MPGRLHLGRRPEPLLELRIVSEAVTIDWLAWKHEHALERGGNSMTSLAIVAPPRVPGSPDDPFRCEHFRCTMDGRVCLERQGATFLVRNDKSRRPDVRFGHCVSGKCDQGAELRAAFPDYQVGQSSDSNYRRQEPARGRDGEHRRRGRPGAPLR